LPPGRPLRWPLGGPRSSGPGQYAKRAGRGPAPRLQAALERLDQAAVERAAAQIEHQDERLVGRAAQAVRQRGRHRLCSRAPASREGQRGTLSHPDPGRCQPVPRRTGLRTRDLRVELVKRPDADAAPPCKRATRPVRQGSECGRPARRAGGGRAGRAPCSSCTLARPARRPASAVAARCGPSKCAGTATTAPSTALPRCASARRTRWRSSSAETSAGATARRLPRPGAR